MENIHQSGRPNNENHRNRGWLDRDLEDLLQQLRKR